MNITDVLSGRAGVAGVQWVLLGRPMRKALRAELGRMLPDAHLLGPCRLRRAKYKPGRHLTAYFDVTILDSLLDGRSRGNSVRRIEVTWRPPGAEDPRGPMPELLRMQAEAQREGLSAPFRVLTGEAPEWGMRIQVSPLDASFPQLVRLSTPGHVHEMLAALHSPESQVPSPESASPDSRLGTRDSGLPEGLGYTVTPVRYRPRQRHVLRYDPQASPNPAHGVQPGAIFAKLYRADKGVRALRITAAALQVADWLEACQAPIAAARPLAYLPDEAVALYSLLPGTPLSRHLRRPIQQVASHLVNVGLALRALHSAPAELTVDLEPHDFAAEVKTIRRACEHIDTLLPGVGAMVDSILDRATQLHQLMPAKPSVFAHGDLKADHLWVTPARAGTESRPYGLVLIDFDTCYLADPALDIGKFLADLQWWYSEYDTPDAARLAARAQQLFLEGYALGMDGSPGPVGLHDGSIARARLYEALVLVKIAARRVPLFHSDWATRTEHLVKRAKAVLDMVLCLYGQISA